MQSWSLERLVVWARTPRAMSAEASAKATAALSGAARARRRADACGRRRWVGGSRTLWLAAAMVEIAVRNDRPAELEAKWAAAAGRVR